jgi:hypothetical protein
MSAELDESPVLLLLTYDPMPDRREDYFRFVLGEFVPTLERLGLRMTGAWHTAYGDYPLRLTGFVAPDWTTMDSATSSPDFHGLEDRLQDFVVNYQRRVAPLRRRFQF